MRGSVPNCCIILGKTDDRVNHIDYATILFSFTRPVDKAQKARTLAEVSFLSFSLIFDTLWHIQWLSVLWQTCCCCFFTFHVFTPFQWFKGYSNNNYWINLHKNVIAKVIARLHKGIYLVNCHMYDLTFQDNVYFCVHFPAMCTQVKFHNLSWTKQLPREHPFHGFPWNRNKVSSSALEINTKMLSGHITQPHMQCAVIIPCFLELSCASWDCSG